MDLKELDPTAIFETLRRMAAGDPVADEEELPATIQYFRTGEEELVKALRPPALDLLRALAAMVIACAKPVWGDPTCYVKHPDDDVPAWFEPYQYGSGVPQVIHYLVGWERGQKQPILWIGEEDFGTAPGFCLSLMILVFE